MDLYFKVTITPPTENNRAAWEQMRTHLVDTLVETLKWKMSTTFPVYNAYTKDVVTYVPIQELAIPIHELRRRVAGYVSQLYAEEAGEYTASDEHTFLPTLPLGELAACLTKLERCETENPHHVFAELLTMAATGSTDDAAMEECQGMPLP